MRFLTALILVLCPLCACSRADRPITSADIKRYTGIQLCEAATIKDVTTPEETDTVPGFSYHVILTMPQHYQRSFEFQINHLTD